MIATLEVSSSFTFQGARLLAPIVAIIPMMCPKPMVHLRPRDLEPKRAFKPELSTDCDRHHSISTAPLRESQSNYRLQFRNARIDACLASSHPDARTLADYDPDIYVTNLIHSLSGMCEVTSFDDGIEWHRALVPTACTSAIIAHDYMHEQLMRQAGVFEYRNMSDVPYFEPYDPNAYKEPEPEKAIKDMTAEERQALLNKLSTTSGEIEDIEAVKASAKWKPKSYDSKLADGFKTFADDGKEESDVGLLDHIIDVTRETTVPGPTKLLDHSDLEAIRKLAKTEPPGFPIHIFLRNKPIVEAATEVGIKEDAMRMKVTRWFRKAEIMNSTCDLTKLTEEQLNDVLDHGAVYISLPIDGEGDWQWYPLHVEEYAYSTAMAILDFRETLEQAELDQKAGFTGNKKARFTDAIRETKKKYAAIFGRGQVLNGRDGKQFVRPVTDYVSVT